ncbi:flavonol reductase [Aspergillus granulosus]|uniref:Flavonol reductase n=1 Tax=Aspergillus granulosus TaxID=176169 RepID=A0ABR4GTG4_9EURO
MSTVLLTGASGFIGSQVALRTLEAGYTIRFVIRREEQTTKLRALFPKYTDKLSFVVIPDITVSGSFDDALQGVEYVVHVASPLSAAGEDLLKPAVQGTLSVLESALKAPSVKRVIVTASVLSLVSLKPIADGVVIREDNEIDYTVPTVSTLATLPGFTQYHASKLASYKAVLDFQSTHNPSFEIVTIHPVYVFGRSLVQESAEQLAGTNGMLFQALMTETNAFGHYLGVHVDDVAVAHVKALTVAVSSSAVQSYLLASAKKSWKDVYEFVKKEFPTLPIKLEPVDRSNYEVDASKASRELGIEFRGMEVQVGEVVRQQLELRGSA